MKKYEAQAFNKNGVLVNAVYVVKPGDTLLGIRKTVKRLGGDPKYLEKIEPSIVRGLAPGQFVYFNSSAERAFDQQEKVLNNHELERCPYQLVSISKSNFKVKLDAYMGSSNAWMEVFGVNRFQVSDFANSPLVQLKVYHAKKNFLDTSNLGQTKQALDLQLAKNNEVPIEKVLVAAERSPSSEDKHEGPGGLVYLSLVVLVVALVFAYRSGKKKIALDTADL